MTHSAAGFDKPARGRFQSAGGFDIHHSITYIRNTIAYVHNSITYVGLRNKKTIFFFIIKKKSMSPLGLRTCGHMRTNFFLQHLQNKL